MKKILQSRAARATLGGTVAGTIILSGLTWTGQINLDNVYANVQELVERIQGLDDDRTTLMELAIELGEQYESLNARYNDVRRELENLSNAKYELYNAKNAASDRYNTKIERLQGELEKLGKDLGSLRERKEHYRAQLGYANAQINSGQTEIERLEEEVKRANDAAAQLEHKVNEMIKGVEGIQPGIDFDRLPVPSPEVEVSVEQKIREALLRNNITGITENVTVEVVSQTGSRIEVRITDATLENNQRWTFDSNRQSQVSETVRQVLGGQEAWAHNVQGDAGIGYVVVQKGDI